MMLPWSTSTFRAVCCCRTSVHIRYLKVVAKNPVEKSVWVLYASCSGGKRGLQVLEPVFSGRSAPYRKFMPAKMRRSVMHVPLSALRTRSRRRYHIAAATAARERAIGVKELLQRKKNVTEKRTRTDAHEDSSAHARTRTMSRHSPVVQRTKHCGKPIFSCRHLRPVCNTRAQSNNKHCEQTYCKACKSD